MNEELLPILIEDLSEKFGIEYFGNIIIGDREEPLHLIRSFLIRKINQLMSVNFDRFMNTLYRIDLDESKVMEAFSKENEGKTASILADLIIERQLKRIKTRLEYKTKKYQDSPNN